MQTRMLCMSLSVVVLAVATPSLMAATPSAITDLRFQAIGARELSLAWTVPDESGGVGLGAYDVRYATSPIEEATWDAATQAAGEPTPGTPGATEQFTVTGLSPGTVYYFAVKTLDASTPANVSDLSNVVTVATRPPASPVVVHNPWLVNDRVADCHNIDTMAATYVNAYTTSGVIPPSSPEDKAINIYNNQKRRLYHWADEPPALGGNDINDPTYNQNVFGWSLCGRQASQACTIVNAAAGISPRKINLPGHWIYEVSYGDNTWHAYDTMTTMYVYNKATSRTVASCAQMKADSTILSHAVVDGRACPGFLLCGDGVSGYQTMVNGWSSYGNGSATARWNGNMDLRFGQSFDRTCEAWQNQHPNPRTNADSDPGLDPPYHHECQNDWKDSVNWPYWEPYGQVIPYIHTTKATYRRWSNGTDTLAPDFRDGGYTALLEPGSHGLAAYNEDGLTPDLHTSTVGTQGEAIFKISIPFYLTDAVFTGDFVKLHSGDVCKVYFSTNGTSWTQVYDAPVGTTHVENFSLRSNVFAKWTTWYIKLQFQATTALADAGVSNFVVVTTFEHNKGAMAYLDKGVNHITLTFDNPAELQASGGRVHVVYKWKEFDGSWDVDKQFEIYAANSPTTFTITTGGLKVPRTASILMEVTPAPYDPVSPNPIIDLAAGPAKTPNLPLTWTATGDDADAGAAAIYDLRYSTSPITDMASFNAATPVAGMDAPKEAGSPEQLTLTNMAPGTYYLAIVAYDDGNNSSGLSNVITVNVAPDPPPAQITDLAAINIQQNSAVLVWTAPGEDGMDGTAARYDLRYTTLPITDMASFLGAAHVSGLPSPQAGGTGEQFTVNGLAPNITYNFAIVAYDATDQISELSNVISVTTPPMDPPPSVISDLAVLPGSIGRHSLTLTWTAPGEDYMVGTASSYDLRYSTDPLDSMAAFNAATQVTGLSAPQPAGTAEQFTVTGLAINTTYDFAIIAYDAAGHASPLQYVVQATTAASDKAGDINGDGYVNVGDLQAIISAWGSNDSGLYGNWNPDADLNADGFVNVSDLQSLVACWNT